jgi:hypothetical protein
VGGRVGGWACSVACLLGAREQGHQNSAFASAFRGCIYHAGATIFPALPGARHGLLASLAGGLQEDLALLQQFAEDDAVNYKGKRIVAQ